MTDRRDQKKPERTAQIIAHLRRTAHFALLIDPYSTLQKLPLLRITVDNVDPKGDSGAGERTRTVFIINYLQDI